MARPVRQRPAPVAPPRLRARSFVSVFLALLGIVLVESVRAYDVCSDDGACIHEYMAEQAKVLYTNSEIDTYFESQIKIGTGHEDEKDHIFSLSWFEGALVTITHFWDSDNGPDDPVENVVGSFPNGWQKVKSYWSLAQGAYAKGDKGLAYHWLGHVVHHMGDNTLPTHVHDDMHWPDDDAFEEWMSLPNYEHAGLSDQEKADLLAAGPIQIPEDQADKLYWLLYTTNQIADFFGSDDYDGDAVDPNGWVQDELDAMAALGDVMPRTKERLLNNDELVINGLPFGDYDNDEDGDLTVIRHYSYLRGIRSIAALYKLFEETVTEQVSAAIVIESVSEVDDDHDTADGADYWARVSINGRGAQNRGDEVVDTEDINPGWAFGHTVGISGTIPMWIEIWDHDGYGEDFITFSGDDDQSDVDPGGGLRLNFDLDISKCLHGEAGAITGPDVAGNCGDFISVSGNNDDEASHLTFRVIMSKSPPNADTGGPYTTPEGTSLLLDGSGTTDNDDDITEYAWDLDGDGDCDDGSSKFALFNAVGQDGVTTVKLCVTDLIGLTDEATTTVTVTNVAPAVNLESSSPDDENSTTTVSGTISDPGWLDPLTATISWGDGSSVEPLSGSAENEQPDATFTFSATHVYGDNGTFVVEVCGSDDDTSTCQQVSIVADNVQPTATINTSTATNVNGTPTFIVHEGQPLAVQGRSVDPGSDDLTLGWNWGDGTPLLSNKFQVNPPLDDPAVSPTIQPRDLTDPRIHTYAAACAYLIGFSSGDDDGGGASTSANVIVVGNGSTFGAGIWRHQFRYYNTGNGTTDFTAARLTCYLQIVRYMSKVFDEAVALSSFVQAEDVLWKNGTSDTREQFDQQLLAAWLSFADGAFNYFELIDTNSDGVPDTTILAAISNAETVRLNPASTDQQIAAQKNILTGLNKFK